MNIDSISHQNEAGIPGEPTNITGPASGPVAVAARPMFCQIVGHGLIRVGGPDAEAFLHNLLTNDVKGLGQNRVQRAGLCTPKGRLLADFLVWRQEGGFLLQMSSDILPGIVKKLSMYILRSKASIADASAEFAVYGLWGENLQPILAGLEAPMPAPMQTVAFTSGSTIGLTTSRVQVLVKINHAAHVRDKLSPHVRQASPANWSLLDIEAGIPHVTIATQEMFVPQMVNFELVDGIGFKKGCYPGQEIVARTQYLGKIRKRMLRASVTGGMPVPGGPLYAPTTGDQACGNLVNVVPLSDGEFEMLAVVPSEVATAVTIHLGAPNGPCLRLLDLPYPVD